MCGYGFCGISNESIRRISDDTAEKCATSWADSIVWILLAEQIVYAYKYLIK